MPYNTNAIPPRKEPTGQTQLPLTRVKKIVQQDSDIHMCSNNAAFIITLAAEMFVQHLAQEANTQTKLDRKPRRNIQYKDLANAVAHRDNLEFLQDVVPKTTPFRKIKATASATQSRLRATNTSAFGNAIAEVEGEGEGEGEVVREREGEGETESIEETR
ncbi:hypothetical protein E4U31_001883 [Claviceps sp. LM219 group G6]|nr:hypothetical protein E4U15_006757 [Claviceps sp. LM218 group G6]KAG6104594.1 hypothetical protein E4U31_001883 [Claviceps sp. LM219 group G6]